MLDEFLIEETFYSFMSRTADRPRVGAFWDYELTVLYFTVARSVPPEYIPESFYLEDPSNDCPLSFNPPREEGTKCCPNAGKYNGFGSDRPLSFVCPKSCPCHD